MNLSVSRHRRDAAHLIEVTGDIDLASKGILQAELSQVIQSSSGLAVEVDLSGVDFMDSSGIAVLLAGRRLAEEREIPFRVVAVSEMVERVLTLTGLWPMLSGDSATAQV